MKILEKTLITAVLTAGLFLLAAPTAIAAASHADLMTAAFEGHTETMKSLISDGADVNARSEDNETALMAAAIMGHEDIVDILLENRADINAKSKHGETA